MAITAKKGEEVCLLGFTGMRIGMRTISAATKDTLTITKVDGTEMIFNRKTGIQTNMAEGKERFAGKIVNASEAPPEVARKPKATPAPAPTPAKGKGGKVVNIAGTPAPAAKGKSKPAPVVADDEYEEV